MPVPLAKANCAFRTSMPKPPCSMSKRTKSAPALAAIWRSPGEKNSTANIPYTVFPALSLARTGFGRIAVSSEVADIDGERRSRGPYLSARLAVERDAIGGAFAAGGQLDLTGQKDRAAGHECWRSLGPFHEAR